MTRALKKDQLDSTPNASTKAKDTIIDSRTQSLIIIIIINYYYSLFCQSST